MKCPNCQFANRESVKFCEKCGAKMELACHNCGAKIPLDRHFCGECGHNLTLPSEPVSKGLSFDEKLGKIQRYLPMGLTEKILSQRAKIEGERKQVTVMFCDMEGFTRLSERLGPEDAYGIMDQVYEILIHKVHNYEGTINEMTGDGIMALYGAPIALEDAPQRAIRSAYSIHREMVRFSDKIRQKKGGIPIIKMRIGIHTGTVVVGTLGNDLRVEFKAVGDTVNLASRIERLAEPGSSYVTEETFKLTEGLFRFEALGQKKVKGKDQPVKVYRVIAPSTMKTRFDVSAERGLTPFVGRERELELLIDGFNRCKSGKGQAFSIISEAGLGKSRLLYELRKVVSNEEVTFLEGKCLSYSSGVAYHPIIDILKSNFNIVDGDRDDTIQEKVRNGIKALEADDETTRPYILELLSARISGIDKKALGPVMMKVRVKEALKRIVLKGSEIRPLIMAVEDLHWIDRSSEEHLKELLDYISGAKVLLIFTYRPEFVQTWGGKSYHNQVNLNRLSNRESLKMLAHLLGSDDIDRDLEELVLNKTEGIPFFIEEFVKSLIDLHVIERENKIYRIARDIKSISTPAKIQDVIMARVDALPNGAKKLLQTVAVVGREFSHELIRQIVDRSEEELMSDLSVLKDSELLYERGIYPQSTYVFKHALTQDVAYSSLLQKQRKEIHGKIGKVMEDLYPERIEENHEVLAHHYERSDNYDKTLKYLDLANQKAIQVCAMEQAKAYFEKFMNVFEGISETERYKEWQISLLVRQNPVFDLLLEYPKYFALLIRYEAMAAELGNQELLGRFYASLGNCEYWFGKLDKSIQTLTEAIKFYEVSRNAEYIGYAYKDIALCYYFMGDFHLAITSAENALKVSESSFDPRCYVIAVSVVSWAYTEFGLFGRAIEEGQKALNIAEKYSNNSLISYATYTIAYAFILKGDLDRAIEYCKQAVEKAQTPRDRLWSETYLGWALCRVGEPIKGIDHMTKLLLMSQASRFLPMELWIKFIIGEGYWLAGEQEKSKQILENALGLAERLKMKFWVAFAHRILGEISTTINPDKAAIHFDKSINAFKKIGAQNELSLTYASFAKLHKHQGNFAEAIKHFKKSLEIFERLGTLIEPEKVKKELADLRGR